MYHGSCPLLFSTGEGFGSRRRARPSPVVRLVEAVHAACSLTSLIVTAQVVFKRISVLQ